MADYASFPDLSVEIHDYVATVEIHRPPHNFFDEVLINSLADCWEALDDDASVRAAMLCAEGKSFCAGANFNAPTQPQPGQARPTQGGHLYQQAVRLFRTKTPVVAAVQGAAVGGGLGLALWPDFRVASPEARFTANFARLGFHHGFGLSATLPRLVGQQHALDLLLTGRRIGPDEALAMGMVEKVVPSEALREEAWAFAREIAISAPLATREIRLTMRGNLAEAVQAATDHELEVQDVLRKTEDFKEGVRAYTERREPNFQGK
ncbi:MAG: enoyl-CoA hydratase/isomerase family protein [Acidimicrobiales bacterium]